jgi:predicted phosphodiesterase
MIIVGDVHGNVNLFWKKFIQNKSEEVIQLGDFGFKKPHDWFIKNCNSEIHKICFGNHDYYPYLHKDYSLGDWSYNEKYKLFTVRGAESTLDKYEQQKRGTWYEEEELDPDSFDIVFENYKKYKPEIVVSHDCPKVIAYSFFGIYGTNFTREKLEELFEYHQPLLWIFGHHHESITKEIDGTKFKCLTELEGEVL